MTILKRMKAIPLKSAKKSGEDIKPMKGHSGLLRLRVGEYRITYSVDNGELTVYVLGAGNRGQIYKRY